MAEKDFKVKNGLVVNDSATFQANALVVGNLTVQGTVTGSFEGSVAGFDSDFASKSTSDLTEGSNLYYTTARADSDAKHAISLTDAGGDGSMTYSSDTGVITYTGPSASEVRAHFSASTGVTITDGAVSIGQDVGTTDNVTFAKITGDSAALDNIKFNSRATAPSSTFGTMYYDSDEQKGPSITLRTLENTSPGVTLNVGQEILLYVHNLTGAQVNNGEAVYISGTAHGMHPQISLAKADASGTANPTGIATMDIPDNAHGWVTRYGMVRDLNTSAFTAGDVLYLSKDSAGQLTSNAVTTETGYPVHVARVMAVDSTEGMILVDPLAEHFEYLRIQDELRVTGKIIGDSAELAQIDFDTNYGEHIPYREGALWYDNIHKTLNFWGDDSGVVHEIGIEEHQRVYNNTGSTISKGKPLYFSGNYAPGGDILAVPTVGLADATDVNAYNAQGLAAGDIPNNSYGYIIISGQIDGLDTSALNAGTNFFVGLGPGLTQNASPLYPNFPMCLGWVVNSDSSDGVLLVNQQNHSVNSFRVRTSAHIGTDLQVDGNLTVLGTQTTVGQNNVTQGAPFYRLNEGDAIGEANTVFTGTGLDDAFFAGHFTGTASQTYYVRIDGVGTGPSGVDTFEVALGDDSTFSAPTDTKVAITGDTQLIHSLDNISVEFASTTGHDSGDRWSGTASPINVDTGFFTNRNTGASGVGYTHMGFYFDVSDEKWKVLDEYDSTPTGTINVTDSSLGTLVADTFEGSFTGDVTGNASTATALASARNFSLTGDVTASNISFDGTGNVQLTTVYNPGSIVNEDINASAAIADTKLNTISTAGKVQNSATTATDANTGSTIVARDASGDFSAGVITADFNRSANTTVEAGTYGSASLVPVLTVDSSGFIDSIGNVSVAGVASLAFDSATHTFTINTADGGSFSEIVQTKMPGSSGSFGSASLVPVITVNEYGLVDSVSTVSVAGVSTFDFDSSTGKLTIGTADGGSFQQVLTLDPYTTSTLTEGTNEYFTQARARGSISVTDAGGDGSLGYNSGTGEITYTGPSASEVRAHFSGGTGITYNSGTGEITTTDADIVHDNLSGFVADEHVAHTSVTITAGSGLTGGGDISATRTLNVGAGLGISVTADAVKLDSATIGSFGTPILEAIKARDGAGTGLDADTLDGQEGSYYRIDVYDASGTLLN